MVIETLSTQRIWKALGEIPDPEVPAISIVDLGIVRDVRLAEDDAVTVVITPTYSGCPAMYEIGEDVKKKINTLGYSQVSVETQLSPAWTTDWMNEETREKLRQFGIAPPCGQSSDLTHEVFLVPVVPCPQCGSHDTKRVSEFGSTACKAHYQCNVCLEPFDYFKVI